MLGTRHGPQSNRSVAAKALCPTWWPPWLSTTRFLDIHACWSPAGGSGVHVLPHAPVPAGTMRPTQQRGWSQLYAATVPSTCLQPPTLWPGRCGQLQAAVLLGKAAMASNAAGGYSSRRPLQHQILPIPALAAVKAAATAAGTRPLRVWQS